MEAALHGMNATLDITQIEKLIEPVIHFPPKIRDEQVYNFPKGQTKYMGEAKDMVKLTMSGKLEMSFSDGSHATYDSNPSSTSGSYCLEYVTSKCSYDKMFW